ncbi:NAD+ synthase [Sediminicurvatus halobius]|uniref:Glutamine-dependent NAD(+) synthetase n=1 Tax=Sediminicurvatus halobius TaxID=2182432 RepID=A0A2U2N0P7_9GAMM|nr:NAD+ synthase [Spiribacter halobius]PWG62623.1 NAD+ synthase [Spiribacter halobius]UEX78458.1 NAD+ synthase [Spiribacter halobius]
MTEQIRFAMAQINLLVGDVAGNTEAAIAAAESARDDLGAEAVIFPELTLTGYPPDDLLLRADFIRAVEAGIRRIQEGVRGITVIIGAPMLDEEGLLNAALVLRDGELLGTYGKHHLPTYGVFDDRRYFTPGEGACVVEVAGCRVGVTVCEDAWHPGPVAEAAAAGAEVVVNINASPFDQYKWMAREAVLRERIGETGLPILYCNMAGGQDEVVYDGGSCAFDGEADLMVRAPRFRTGLYPVDLARIHGQWQPLEGEIEDDPSDEAVVYEALVWGVRDYIEKNRFPGVVIGLSGGMDSALTACIAVDALGPERVHCVMMPTRYTSDMSRTDAGAVAEALGVRYDTVAIEDIFNGFTAALAPVFSGRPADVTEENLQSRIRGALLMAVSNKLGGLVLATGNKSEMAVGYATLYGDMVGGFSPLKDIFKTEVYRLARYRNELGAVIPENIFTRPPSAELAPDQKDTDSLPDYPELDAILAAYVEEDASIEEIVAAGHDHATVARVVRLVHRNEYKRRQAAPGVKVTAKAFGRDRRYPITSGFGR